MPVGFRYNLDMNAIDIGGHNDVLRNGRVAFVMDDALPSWRPRFGEIRGTVQPVPCKNIIQSVLLQKPVTPLLSIGRMESSLTLEHIIRWIGSSSSIFSQPFYRSSTLHDYPTRKKIWKS